MFDLMGLMEMMGNYEDRKVARYEEGEIIVSTCMVTDGSQPFETAVAHPRYYGGDFIVVEAYDSRLDAAEGHNRWVATMTAEELPDKLVDCQNAHISQSIPEDRFVYERDDA